MCFGLNFVSVAMKIDEVFPQTAVLRCVTSFACIQIWLSFADIGFFYSTRHHQPPLKTNLEVLLQRGGSSSASLVRGRLRIRWINVSYVFIWPIQYLFAGSSLVHFQTRLRQCSMPSFTSWRRGASISRVRFADMLVSEVGIE